jgi:hypothetical protein
MTAGLIDHLCGRQGRGRRLRAFGGRIESAKPGAPANRIRKTIPPPGAYPCASDWTNSRSRGGGVFIGISVRATSSPAMLFGPTTVPSDYAFDGVRYILRPPSPVSRATIPRCGSGGSWRTAMVGPCWSILTGQRTGGYRLTSYRGRSLLRISASWARLYRQLGVVVSELGTQSVNVHMRSSLPPGAYVRWRWQGSNPQLSVVEATDTWYYAGGHPSEPVVGVAPYRPALPRRQCA